MKSSRRRQHGQALVEFSIAIVLFLTMLFAIVEFGRAIYQFNAVGQAAREIARVTSVHPGTSFASSAGWSNETKAVIATQKGLIPRLGDPTITCVDVSGNPHSPCNFATDSVKVVIKAPFKAVTPPMSFWSQWDMQGSSTLQIQ